MRPPRVTPAWVRGGWEIEKAHVPGSYRMLGIWGLSGVAALVVTNVGAALGELHAGMYAGAGVGTAGILAGAALYRRCEKAFTLPDAEPWSAGLVAPGRLADVLADESPGREPAVMVAPGARRIDGVGVHLPQECRVRPQEEYVLLAAELRAGRGGRW